MRNLKERKLETKTNTGMIQNIHDIYKNIRLNLLLCRLPKTDQQAVVNKAFQFLTVTIIADTYDRYLGDFYASNQVSNTTSITSRHPIHLIHDQNSLRKL